MPFPTYRDDFETPSLNTDLWHANQVPNKERQIGFSEMAHKGARSINLHVTDGDGGEKCNNKCQRAELRTRGRLRPKHEDEFWHAFSFRVTGEIPVVGSVRTVLGQWKAPGDDSPFLAQRFDNGVFHITVQDGLNRRTVASAQGDPERMDTFQDLIADLWTRAPELLHASRAMADLKLFRAAGNRFDEIFEPEFAQDLVSGAEVLAGARRSETQLLFDEFSFIHDLAEYAHMAKVRTRHVGKTMLPDPKDDWVRMAYRIKAGREDNNPRYAPRREGEIDIYANDVLIAEVRGDIGYQITSPPSHDDIYFKFGIYRDKLPGTLTLHFDDFAQGRTKSEVD